MDSTLTNNKRTVYSAIRPASRVSDQMKITAYLVIQVDIIFLKVSVYLAQQVHIMILLKNYVLFAIKCVRVVLDP